MEKTKKLLKKLIMMLLVISVMVGQNSMATITKVTNSVASGGNIASKAKQDFPRTLLSGTATRFYPVKYGVEQNQADITNQAMDINEDFIIYIHFEALFGGTNGIQKNDSGKITLFENATIKGNVAWENRQISGAYDAAGNPLNIGTMAILNEGNNTIIQFTFSGEDSAFSQSQNIIADIRLDMRMSDLNSMEERTIFSLAGKQYIFVDGVKPYQPIQIETGYVQHTKEKKWSWEMRVHDEHNDLDGLTVHSQIGIYQNAINRDIFNGNQYKTELAKSYLGEYIANSLKIKNEATGSLSDIDPANLEIDADQKGFQYTFPNGTGKNQTLVFDYSIAGDPGYKVPEHHMRYQSPSIEGYYYNFIRVSDAQSRFLPIDIYKIRNNQQPYYISKDSCNFELLGERWISFDNLTGINETDYWYVSPDLGAKEDKEIVIKVNHKGFDTTDLLITYTLPKFLDFKKAEILTRSPNGKYELVEDITTRQQCVDCDGNFQKRSYTISGNSTGPHYLRVTAALSGEDVSGGEFPISATVTANEVESELPNQQKYYEIGRSIIPKHKRYQPSVRKVGKLAKHQSKLNWEINLTKDSNEASGLKDYKLYDLVLYDKSVKSIESLKFSNNADERPEIPNNSETFRTLLRTGSSIGDYALTLVQSFDHDSLQIGNLQHKFYPIYVGEKQVGEVLEISGFDENTPKYTIKFQTNIVGDELHAIVGYRTENPDQKRVFNRASLFKGEKSASWDGYFKVAPEFYMNKRFMASNYVDSFLKNPTNPTSMLLSHYTGRNRSSAYSYGEKAILIGIDLCSGNFNWHKNLPELIGNINITESLPEGWTFAKINEENDFLVFGSDTPFGNITKIIKNHPLKVAGDFIGKDKVKFNYQSDTFGKMMIILKAVPSTDTLLKYAENGEPNRIDFRTVLSGDASPLKIISDDFEYIKFDKKILFKKEELKPKVGDSDWQIQWKVDYVPQGLMEECEQIYVKDTLAENINIRLTAAGKPNLTANNFELYEAKLKPGTREIDGDNLIRVTDYLTEDTLVYDADTRTMKLMIPDKNKNYRFRYMTDMKKDVSHTSTLNVVTIEGTIFKVKPVGRQIDINSVTISTATKIPLKVKMVWKAYDGKDEAFAERHKDEVFDVHLLRNNKDSGQKKSLSYSHQWMNQFENVPIEWQDDELIAYDIKLANSAINKDYTSVISGSMFEGFTITNTENAPKKRIIKVLKNWVGEPGSKITLKLKGSNGKSFQSTLGNGSAVPGKPNQWEYTFVNLEKFEADRKTLIQYTLEEESIAGYISKITGNMEDGFVVTNTMIKKPDDKKPDDKKPDDKKPDDKKPDDKKPDDKKPEDKKPDDKKPEDKKPDDKKPNNPKPVNPKPNTPYTPDVIVNPEKLKDKVVIQIIDENNVPIGKAEFDSETNTFVFVNDDRIPEGTAKIHPDNSLEILDDDVPLDGMPKTGGMGTGGFVSLGLLTLLAGLLFRRRAN